MSDRHPLTGHGPSCCCPRCDEVPRDPREVTAELTELRAENERLRGELVEAKDHTEKQIAEAWFWCKRSVAWKALARRARDRARQMAEDDTTLRRLVDHGNEWEVRIARVKDERDALRARLEAAERVCVQFVANYGCAVCGRSGHAPGCGLAAWLALREKGDTSK